MAQLTSSMYCPIECQNYSNLTNADRKKTYIGNSQQSDSGIGPGWFRFEGDAGTRMASSCPPVKSCDSRHPGWLEGSHPSVADGKSYRKVCFRKSSECKCFKSTTIRVRNCTSFYVYYLHGVPVPGSLRYCGSDN